MTQSIAASAVAAAASSASATTQSAGKKTYFELRRYSVSAGPPMAKLTDDYLSGALIPALNRLGISPVGAFKLDIGPDTPATYLLIPSESVEALANVGAALARDEAFVKGGEPFNSISADHPAFRRIDSTLLAAFRDFTPAAMQGRYKRIFQLRIYDSPTPTAHERKVAMFQQGEIDIFLSVGFRPVFFAQALIGASLPSLTYMLTFNDMDELNTKWAAFSSAPAWRKLVSQPGNGDDSLIREITNLILSPKPYSQI
jgi:hypothetical protein